MEAGAGSAVGCGGLALRRTAASGMAQLAVPPHIIERVLNHTTGTLGGVAGIYNRYGYLAEMRQALEHWSGRVGALVQAL